MKKMKFSVITPCFNSRNYLPATVDSVLSQAALLNGKCDVQYIIVDGGSHDGTKEYLANIDHPNVKWISEPDAGMYDALVKGFAMADGDVYSYINAGDTYFPWAFDVMSAVFADESVNWATGLPTLFNETGEIFQVERARRYWSSLIECGLYGKKLPYIQQESTFWRSSLWRMVDLDQLRQLKLAGDYFIWRSFAAQFHLDCVNSVMAAFRIHPGQLSESKDRYFSEFTKMKLRAPGFLDQLLASYDLLASLFPARVQRVLGYDSAIRFDLRAQRWCK